jgi:hypothetical protein
MIKIKELTRSIIMKKVALNMELDAFTEMAIERFCRDNNMTVEEFVEDAIFEKLDSDGMDIDPIADYDSNDMAKSKTQENTLLNFDSEFYKRKH